MNTRTILPFLGTAIIGLWPMRGNAQQAMQRKADKLYAEYSFAEAIICYERAFQQGAMDEAAAHRLADCYYRVRDLSSAEKWYGLVVAGQTAAASDFRRYSEALRSNAKYAQADSVMRIYAAMDTSDSRGRALIQEMIPSFLIDPLFEGTLVELPWNSPELDLAPALLGEQIVFASAGTPQAGIQRTNAWDGRAFLNLYVRTDSSTVPLRGSVNTKYHESDPSFSADGTEMYFTRNNTEAANDTLGGGTIDNLVIMSSRLVNGTWTEAVLFPFQAASFSTGHPSLSADGRSLYFSSDRPGGLGGADIWRSDRQPGGDWQEPVNLGPNVNTEGEEMFPRINGDHALFFSSDGRAGLGGLDVFLTWDFSIGPQEPVNLGAPINSRADDMSLVLTKDGTTGYFSSDRKGGVGSADIHKVELAEPFERKVLVNGRILSAEDSQPLANVPVQLERADRTVLAKQLTDAEGAYDFVVAPQAVTIRAGIPGASEYELPMDETVLLALDDEVPMADIQITTVVNAPVDVRMYDACTGMPVPGMKVQLRDETHGGQVVAEGLTDDRGMVHGILSGVRAHQEVQLSLTASIGGLPTVGVQLSFFVQDGLLKVLEQEYDMGARMDPAFQKEIKDTFFFLYDDASGGAAWNGRVLDERDGTPVAHAGVSMRDIDAKEIARTTTGPDGRYRLRSHDIGSSIVVSLPGGDRRLVEEISPFGSEEPMEIEVQSVMDLAVTLHLKDAMTGAMLEGAAVKISDARDGRLLFTGVTNTNGICLGKISARRFGTKQRFEVAFEKEGYLPLFRTVDHAVLTFKEGPLGGIESFPLTPKLIGSDLGVAMDLKPIFFEYKRTNIGAQAATELDRMVKVMQVDPSLEIELRSHTDSRGGAAYNQELSQARAEQTKAYLVAHGIASGRIRAVGVGKAEPINACDGSVPCTEEQHMANRRTEFVLMACSGCATVSAR